MYRVLSQTLGDIDGHIVRIPYRSYEISITTLSRNGPEIIIFRPDGGFLGYEWGFTDAHDIVRAMQAIDADILRDCE